MGESIASKLLIFAGGVAVGIGIGTFLQKRKAKNETNEQIDVMREYYEERYAKKNDIQEEPIEKKEDPEIIAVKNDYRKLTRAYASYEKYDKDEEEKIFAEAEHPTEEDKKRPYFIKEEACGYGYDECEVTLYLKDMTLVDDASNEEIDAEESLGKENLVIVANSPNERDLYIRNERMGLDYIVHRNSGSFKEIMSEYYDESRV